MSSRVVTPRQPEGRSSPASSGHPRRIGLVAGGLGAYWPQFPDLLPQLQRSARRVSERMQALDCDVVDVGFISDAQDGARAAEQLRAGRLRPDRRLPHDLHDGDDAGCRSPSAAGAPVLLINLQPTEVMDHATFDTGQWLAYCGACPLPEMANTFLRCGRRLPLGVRASRGRAGLGQDRPLDQGRRRPRGAAARPARPDGPPLPRDARRLDRPDTGPRPARRPHGGARVRRPAGAGRRGHRRHEVDDRMAWPARSSTSTTASRTTTSAGPPRFRSGSTGSSTTSARQPRLLPPRARGRDSTSGSAPG